MIKISFSWDDGALQDLKLMDLSLRYQIPAIFFIPATNTERPTLTKDDIKVLNRNGFEIGAHTYSHSYLIPGTIADARKDIIEGKDFLEQLLSVEVPHFCFPGGRYDSSLVVYLKEIFKSARTADTGAIIKLGDFLIKPAFHFSDRGKRSIIINSLKNYSPIFPASLRCLLSSDYFSYIQRIIFDLSANKNEFRINIWGHSWEIEQFNLWGKLKELFKYVKEHCSNSIIGYSEIIDKY